MTGSDASIELIRDVIQSGQLSDADVSSWLTSIALVPQPTEEILNAAKVRKIPHISIYQRSKIEPENVPIFSRTCCD